MNKTSLMILLVFLVGATGAVFVWTGDDATHLTSVASESWLDADPAVADPLEAAVESVEDPGDQSKSELPDGFLASMREEVAGAEGNTRLLVVQVWNGKKGVPAAETDVFFLDGFKGSELEDPFARHWSDLAESRGQKFKTDTAGRVKLPPVQDWAMVTAQGAGTYGFTKVGRRHRNVETIMLQLDETVTVRVVDGEDRPVAGVPVGVVQRVAVQNTATQYEQIMAEYQMLGRAVANVEQYIRDNPAQRTSATAKLNSIREQQIRLRSQLGQMKNAGKGQRKGQRKGRGGGKGKGKKRTRLAKTAKQPKPKVTTRKDLRARRRTNSEGVAVFRHFQVYRHQKEQWWPSQHVDQFQAVLLMPLQQPESREFSGRPVPTETLELRLPATGSIALRTIDIDGRPFTHPVHGDLRMHGDVVVPWARVHVRKEQNQTEIVFPFVGLGLKFTAFCRLDDEDFRWSLANLIGPSNAGERVTIDVVVAPNEGMLFGRLFDGDGKPLAGIRPTFLINTTAGRLEGEDVTIDKDGRFHLPYQVRDQHRGPFRLEIRRNDMKPVAGLVMALPGIPPGRVTDLGDLRIDDFGVIAHGTVIDDRGVPIRGASIQLQRHRDLGGKQPKLAFVDEAFVTGRSDEDGRYEIFGSLESGRYRLRVQARNHFPHDTRDLRQGDRLDPKLQRISKVVGTVLTPSWLPSKSIRVVLQSVLDAKQRRQDQIHDHKGKKYIYFDRVLPGFYTIEIYIQDFPDPIHRIDGLEIEAGQLGLHPRIRDLDLGVYLHRFALAAVDELGQPIKPDWPLIARIVRPDGRTSFVGFPWRGRTIEIVSASRDLEVFPMAAGYRADRTVVGPGPSELRFMRIPPVELQLPGLRRLVGEALVWIALRRDSSGPPATGGLPRSLESWDGRSGRIAGAFARKQRGKSGKILGQGDTLRIPLMQDGRFKVFAYLLGTTKKRKSRAIAVQLGVVNVRLVPGAGPLRLPVNIDAERIQKAMAELAQREASRVGRK